MYVCKVVIRFFMVVEIWWHKSKSINFTLKDAKSDSSEKLHKQKNYVCLQRGYQVLQGHGQ
jgi:hypothetical protein